MALVYYKCRMMCPQVLSGLAAEKPDAFVVHREDLPAGSDVFQALRDGFGAEPGDDVVEVRLGAAADGLVAQRRRTA